MCWEHIHTLVIEKCITIYRVIELRVSLPATTVSRIIDEKIGTGLFQYFIKVVPTVYSDDRGEQLFTNQFTYTERFRPLTVPSATPGAAPVQNNAVLPGIFFVYDLSPFVVEVTRTRVPLLHFLTRVLAITGGVFSVLGVLDSAIFRIQCLLTTKQ